MIWFDISCSESPPASIKLCFLILFILLINSIKFLVGHFLVGPLPPIPIMIFSEEMLIFFGLKILYEKSKF